MSEEGQDPGDVWQNPLAHFQILPFGMRLWLQAYQDMEFKIQIPGLPYLRWSIDAASFLDREFLHEEVKWIYYLPRATA